jgi:2-polyprenyl-6-methoxyphenol hydroxylase-like FAD-dependent oxidoreductase
MVRVAGLTLATALRRQGLKLDLIERNPTWQAVGTGFLLQANRMCALNAIGLGNPVRRVRLSADGHPEVNLRGEGSEVTRVARRRINRCATVLL